MSNQCSECNISLDKKPRSSYTKESSGIIYCKRCYKWLSKKPKVTDVRSTVNDDADSSSACNNEVSISVPISRSSDSHVTCIFDLKTSESLRLLSWEECMHIYFKTNSFVKYGARVCKSHVENNSLQIAMSFKPYSDDVVMTSSEIHDLLGTFKKMYIKDTTFEPVISFLNMKDDLFFETGLNTTEK